MDHVQSVDGENVFSDNFALFLGDLSIFCEEKDVEQAFSRFGEIIDIRIQRSKETARALAYGFIEFAVVESAMAALNEMNGYVLKGRPLRIRWAANRNAPVKSAFTLQDTAATVYVKFITQTPEATVTEETLRNLFNRYGRVLDCAIKKLSTDQKTNKKKGYGFISFDGGESQGCIGGVEGIEASYRAVNELRNKVEGDVRYRCELGNRQNKLYAEMVNPASSSSEVDTTAAVGSQQTIYPTPLGSSSGEIGGAMYYGNGIVPTAAATAPYPVSMNVPTAMPAYNPAAAAAAMQARTMEYMMPQYGAAAAKAVETAPMQQYVSYNGSQASMAGGPGPVQNPHPLSAASSTTTMYQPYAISGNSATYTYCYTPSSLMSSPSGSPASPLRLQQQQQLQSMQQQFYQQQAMQQQQALNDAAANYNAGSMTMTPAAVYSYPNAISPPAVTRPMPGMVGTPLFSAMNGNGATGAPAATPMGQMMYPAAAAAMQMGQMQINTTPPAVQSNGASTNASASATTPSNGLRVPYPITIPTTAQLQQIQQQQQALGLVQQHCNTPHTPFLYQQQQQQGYHPPPSTPYSPYTGSDLHVLHQQLYHDKSLNVPTGYSQGGYGSGNSSNSNTTTHHQQMMAQQAAMASANSALSTPESTPSAAFRGRKRMQPNPPVAGTQPQYQPQFAYGVPVQQQQQNAQLPQGPPSRRNSGSAEEGVGMGRLGSLNGYTMMQQQMQQMQLQQAILAAQPYYPAPPGPPQAHGLNPPNFPNPPSRRGSTDSAATSTLYAGSHSEELAEGMHHLRVSESGGMEPTADGHTPIESSDSNDTAVRALSGESDGGIVNQNGGDTADSSPTSAVQKKINSMAQDQQAQRNLNALSNQRTPLSVVWESTRESVAVGEHTPLSDC